MNVTVMGAGGMGGYFGGMLARAGHRVTLIARGAHLDALRRRGGVVLKTPDGEMFAPAAVVDRPPAHDPSDLILFTVKSFDTAAAAASLAPVVGPQTLILSLQNGVTNEEHLADVYGPDRVLGGAVYMLATISEPGVIEQPGGVARLVFGEWRGGAGDRVRALEASMREAGINATAVDDIQREKWVKFVFILAQGGMTAMTRLPVGHIRTCPPAWLMYRQIMEEAVAVAVARGVAVDADVVEQHVALASRSPGHTITSLLYDLMHEKRLEIEALHGVIIRYGAEARVPTPMCAAVYAALAPHDARAQAAAASRS